MSSSLLSLAHPRYWLVWTGVAFASLLCALPPRWRDRVAALIARLAYRRDSKQINIARTNLTLCFPDWDAEQVEAFLQLYFTRYIQVLLQSPLIWWGDSKAMWRRLNVEGLENLSRETDAGHPVVLLFVHCIGIDFGAVALSSRYTMRGIYKPFDNPVIEWLFRRGRLRFGAQLDMRGNDLRGTLKSLKSGTLLVYLCDEDFGAERSVFAPFFRQPKATLAMLPRLVRHSGAKVIPVFTHYEPENGKFTMTFRPALSRYPLEDELANATTMNQAIEDLISICPEQYLWKLRFFRTRQEGDSPYNYRSGDDPA